MIPLLTLELDRMRQSITTALIDHNDEIRGIVEQTLNDICTPEYLASRIHELSKVAVDNQLKYEVDEYYKRGPGKETIKKLFYAHLKLIENM